jgi:FkbM family methyltransferase
MAMSKRDLYLLWLVRVYNMHTPPFRGKWRIKDSLLGMVKEYPDRVSFRSRDGRKFIADLDDCVNRNMFLDGCFEPVESALIGQVIRRGDVVLDIGAYIGWYTTLFSRLVGAAGEVHCFEPEPGSFEILRENIALNGAGNVFPNRTAVSSETGTTDIYSFEKSSRAHASLSPLGREDCYASSCETNTINRYLDVSKVEKVDFVKIDAEGSELKAIEGGGGLFFGDSPPVLMLEINENTASHFGYAPCDMLRFLHDKGGYDFFRATAGGLQRLSSVEECEHGDNVLGFIESHHRDRMKHVIR